MTYTEKLEQQLQHVEKAIEDAQRKFDRENVSEKVKTLDKLTHLR